MADPGNEFGAGTWRARSVSLLRGSRAELQAGSWTEPLVRGHGKAFELSNI